MVIIKKKGKKRHSLTKGVFKAEPNAEGKSDAIQRLI
jgi:hypothetical protein